ncbi:unnamed protein product [Trichobilharzia regenti]|nr:unnamed protein product [Trichobilharzia regenti]
MVEAVTRLQYLYHHQILVAVCQPLIPYKIRRVI